MEDKDKTRIVNQISRMMQKNYSNDTFLALYELKKWIQKMDKPLKKGPLSKHLIIALNMQNDTSASS